MVMYTPNIIQLFISFLLIASIASSGLSDFEMIDPCYNDPAIYSTGRISSVLNAIKAQLIQEASAKHLILANSLQFEKAKQKLLKCTEELMRRNQHKLLENFIEDVLDPLDLDFSGEIRLIGNQIKKEIDSLVTLAYAKKHLQTVSPAFQWIQSRTNVLLQVKFAHRHDSPGCLEVKDPRVEFSENSLKFSALGTEGQHPIQFELNLNFYKDINPAESSWNLESVGRMFINVTKANPEIWVFLLKNNEKLPQMRFWWELEDNYEEEMKEYTKLVEQFEEGLTPKKSRGRKGRKTEESAAATEPEVLEEKPIDQEPIGYKNYD